MNLHTDSWGCRKLKTKRKSCHWLEKDRPPSKGWHWDWHLTSWQQLWKPEGKKWHNLRIYMQQKYHLGMKVKGRQGKATVDHQQLAWKDIQEVFFSQKERDPTWKVSYAPRNERNWYFSPLVPWDANVLLGLSGTLIQTIPEIEG